MNKLGLIAGNGVFPLEVARAAREHGIKIIAVAHLNESDRALDSVVDEVTWIKVGELQKIVDVFKNAGVSEAAMAGGISRARLKDSFAPDARALKMLSGIGRFSDDAVLRGVAHEVEAEGIKMIDPVPMIEHWLARAGVGAGPDPTPSQRRDLDLAFEVARRLGAYDIGQTVAVRDGMVAAVEALEERTPPCAVPQRWSARDSSWPRRPNRDRTCVSTALRLVRLRWSCSPRSVRR